MLFSRNLLATFLAAAAAVANGAPVEPGQLHCEAKYVFCEGEYWQERCVYPESVVLSKCHNFGLDYNLTNVKSFGPPRGLSCVIFVCVTVPLVFLSFQETFFTRSRCGCAIGPRAALNC